MDDPDGHKVQEVKGESEGMVYITAEKEGDYKICFTARGKDQSSDKERRCNAVLCVRALVLFGAHQYSFTFFSCSDKTEAQDITLWIDWRVGALAQVNS